MTLIMDHSHTYQCLSPPNHNRTRYLCKTHRNHNCRHPGNHTPSSAQMCSPPHRRYWQRCTIQWSRTGLQWYCSWMHLSWWWQSWAPPQHDASPSGQTPTFHPDPPASSHHYWHTHSDNQLLHQFKGKINSRVHLSVAVDFQSGT